MKKIKYQVVFNPYDRTMYVIFKDKLSYHQFESLDEHYGVDNSNYKKDDYLSKNDIWLNVHLHYDEELSLSMDIRRGDDDLDDDNNLFYWTHGKKAKNVHIVYNDEQMLNKINSLLEKISIDLTVGGLGFQIYL